MQTEPSVAEKHLLFSVMDSLLICIGIFGEGEVELGPE